MSGDRVRQAMLEAIGADVPTSLPSDPIAAIAQQLGLSPQQVCTAFFNPQAPSPTAKVTSAAGPGQVSGHLRVLNLNGTEINVDNVDASQLSAPAQKLGVSPDRLAAAVRAALPGLPPAPPAPPDKDELIRRLARNLSMSEDRVRAAITQVEGPNQFYFAVPLPALPKH